MRNFVRAEKLFMSFCTRWANFTCTLPSKLSPFADLECQGWVCWLWWQLSCQEAKRISENLNYMEMNKNYKFAAPRKKILCESSLNLLSAFNLFKFQSVWRYYYKLKTCNFKNVWIFLMKKVQLKVILINKCAIKKRSISGCWTEPFKEQTLHLLQWKSMWLPCSHQSAHHLASISFSHNQEHSWGMPEHRHE